MDNQTTQTSESTQEANSTESIAENERGSLTDSRVHNLADAAKQYLDKPADEESTEESGEWYLMPDVKGEGEKPAWHNNKEYKSVYEQAEIAAKRVNDLRSKLGGFQGAPEEYKINLGDDLKEIEIDKEDPLFKDFTAFAKNNKMTENAYNECLKMFVNYTNLQNEHEGKELNEFQSMELEKLGGAKQASEKIEEMCQWFKQNFSEGNADDLRDMMYFANAYEIIRGMRERMGYAKVPSSTAPQTEVISSHELSALQADPRYLSNPRFQEMVNQKYAQKYAK